MVAGLFNLFFIAFLVYFPLHILGKEITLTPVVTLGTGLIYGPTVAIWSLTLGYLLAAAIPRLVTFKTLPRSTFFKTSWLETLTAIGMESLPLALTFFAFNWEGIAHHEGTIDVVLMVLVSVVFTALHTLFFLTELWLHRPPHSANLRRDLVSLSLVEILPLPFIFITVLAYPAIFIRTVAAIGGIPSILAILMYGMSKARLDLERRLQDLSTIDNISRTLRSTLEMESLLETIHVQVARLLGINSFYVALYNAEEQSIWYPLAVKYGQRQNWPRRGLADRLTDRVILEGKPIMLPRQAREALVRIGLPPGEEPMNAWIGVPLISQERTIGCLAAFSASPESEFDDNDLNLLNILSGQVSVAIENALLYEQAQERAAQLENLNRLSTLITASLELKTVLPQVCKSVIQVSGSKQSAIYLLDPDRGEIQLAHSQGVSVEFVERNRAFSAADPVRARCLRTGQPVLVENVRQQTLDQNLRATLTEANIQALGDFPLTTPDGQIGFLSVYFDTPHVFGNEQVELLQTFASQAALAVSNARLHSQTGMALTRRANQLAILEAVGREISAVTYSDHLFEMILEYALEFTNSTWGNLALYDPQSKTISIKVFKGYALQETRLPDTHGIAGRAIRTRASIMVGDVRQDPDYVDWSDEQAKSQLSVPLINKNRVLGVITLESPELNAYDNNDRAFIHQLANQAAIAVINAELYRETQRRLKEQASLYQVSSRLVGNLRLESVTHTVGQAIGAAMDARMVGVYLWDANQDAYTLRTQIQTTYLETANPLPEVITGGQLRSDHPHMQHTDTLRLYQTKDQLVRHLQTNHTTQALILPLTITGEHFGIVVLYVDKERTYSEEEMQLPKAIAAQGSIAIQNALLFDDVIQGRDRLEAVLNSVGEGIMMIDTSGCITLANEPIETFTHSPPGGLIGSRLLDLSEAALSIIGLDKTKAQELLDGLSKGVIPVTTKSIVRRTEPGPEKVFECTTAPVWSHAERVIGLIIVLRDVTEEHEINQARELITQTLVHDLKSPMSAIISALALIEDATPPDAAERDIIDQSISIAERASRRILTLVDALLDIAKMESGQMELELERVDLPALFEQIETDFLPQARAIGVILQVDAPPTLPTLRMDAGKITRVLINLLDNAFKFTPAGGRIAVTANKEDEEHITIRVADNGPGVPEEYREKIFERFSQIPEIKGRQRGSGLGLTFCRLVVEAHGGRIWVEPNPEGGSVFVFTLPLKV